MVNNTLKQSREKISGERLKLGLCCKLLSSVSSLENIWGGEICFSETERSNTQYLARRGSKWLLLGNIILNESFWWMAELGFILSLENFYLLIFWSCQSAKKIQFDPVQNIRCKKLFLEQLWKPPKMYSRITQFMRSSSLISSLCSSMIRCTAYSNFRIMSWIQSEVDM